MQLSFISVNDPSFHEMFLTMCPTYTFIDRANGKFNSNMSFKREYGALVSAGWMIDQTYEKCGNDPSGESDPNEILGIGNEEDNAFLLTNREQQMRAFVRMLEKEKL